MARPRKMGGRSAKSRILILCEGEQTEINYFNGMKQFNQSAIESFSIDIKVGKTEKNTPYELVNEALLSQEKERGKGNEFDELWVVFDKDQHPKLNDTFQLARSKGVKIVFSSISFEYWILLHFKKTTKPYSNCKSLISDLEREFPEYCKNTQDVYKRTKDKIEDAIKNAAFLRAQLVTSHTSQNIFDVNPYINVDDLVLKILKKKAQYSIPKSMKI